MGLERGEFGKGGWEAGKWGGGGVGAGKGRAGMGGGGIPDFCLSLGLSAHCLPALGK